MKKRRNYAVYTLSVTALMIAVMFLFGFTPIGTIQTGTLTITLMGIPVSIIACIFGPWMGLLAGTIWGFISILQAVLGMDATALLLQSCVAKGEITALRYWAGLICMCLIARMLVGFFTGLIHDAIKIKDKKGYFATFISSACTALLNTILFMTTFCLFFYNTPAIDQLGTFANPFVFVFAIIGVNFIVEFIVNSLAGSTIVFILEKTATKLNINSNFMHFFKKHTAKNKSIHASPVSFTGTDFSEKNQSWNHEDK